MTLTFLCLHYTTSWAPARPTFDVVLLLVLLLLGGMVAPKTVTWNLLEEEEKQRSWLPNGCPAWHGVRCANSPVGTCAVALHLPPKETLAQRLDRAISDYFKRVPDALLRLKGLLENGCDVNYSRMVAGETPFLVAAHARDIDFMNSLLDSGADPEVALTIVRAKSDTRLVDFIEPFLQMRTRISVLTKEKQEAQNALQARIAQEGQEEKELEAIQLSLTPDMDNATLRRMLTNAIRLTERQYEALRRRDQMLRDKDDPQPRRKRTSRTE